MPDAGMLVTEPWYRQAKFWRWVVGVLLLAAAIYLFSAEFGVIFRFLGVLFLGREITYTAPQLREAAAILSVNCIAGIGYFLFNLWFVGQFVLPVRTSEQRWKLFDRLVRYVFGMHGPAIFVKEGVQIARAEELERSLPGVALVDLASAVALEQSWVPVSAHGAPRPMMSGRSLMRSPLRAARRLMGGGRRPRAGRPYQMVRVAGPGVVFTEMGEKVRGAASLRRHFRISGSVTAATRDGFQVQAPVFVLFTLGDAPDNFRVGYYGGDGPEHLRVIKLWEKDNKKVITDGDFIEVFDELDRSEIHHFGRFFRPTTSSPVWKEPEPKKLTKPPYVFDEERVFSAIYSQARTQQEGQVEVWSELPLKVASEVFRDMLALQNYSDLYRPTEAEFPFFQTFRPKFNRYVQNLGVLTYQFVRRKDGRPFEKGMTWDMSEIDVSPVQKLHTSKVLRDRGIKVLVAGFPELRLQHQGVSDTLVDRWSAKWQRDAQLTASEYELEAMRVRAKIKAEAQRDMIFALSEVFNMPDLSREALIWRIFQALETVADDPTTRSLLPTETLNFLWDLRQYLLPPPPTEPMV